eukprot:CAMPEP_0173376554 /NCGR_PEP_ID=MMETSP1144-20121109/30232_1 /TAXON_ID=483371 /ORGANISM="non described non described, Strain CCMP2298" /LENGTH=165 /DNA_ID=CAMNT_0014329081 /DNA_START=53 /DNA_END=550 /DNA_ORIENTATION=-
MQLHLYIFLALSLVSRALVPSKFSTPHLNPHNPNPSYKSPCNPSRQCCALGSSVSSGEGVVIRPPVIPYDDCDVDTETEGQGQKRQRREWEQRQEQEWEQRQKQIHDQRQEQRVDRVHLVGTSGGYWAWGVYLYTGFLKDRGQQALMAMMAFMSVVELVALALAV